MKQILILISFIILISCSDDSTSSIDTSGTVTDIDGNVYQTLTIGTQVWMVENLKVKHYRNGDEILNVTDNVDWASSSTGAYCYYDNDINNSNIYGCIYNWFAVDDIRKIAPVGWHVPKDEEWQTLINFLGGESISGDEMKNTSGWNNEGNGNNKSNFSVLPGGYRSVEFFDLGNYAGFWSSTMIDITSSYSRGLDLNNKAVFRYEDAKEYGLSVRCVKD